jgi:molybdate transport system substrate-binding protein
MEWSLGKSLIMSEIKILSTTAMKTSLDDLGPQFERQTGHTLAPIYGPSARVAQRVADGESFDVAVVTAEGLENLTGQGKVVPSTRTVIARSLIGVAVQKGAPKPDISTADKFRDALLAAKSIAMSNPVGGGQSGAHIAKVFEKLGVAEAVKSKTKFGPGGPAGLIGLFLVRGEADLGVQQIPELMAVLPDIDIVGPLPDEIQAVTVFSVGLSTGARDAEAGKALIKFLATPASAAVIKAKGMEAG